MSVYTIDVAGTTSLRSKMNQNAADVQQLLSSLGGTVRSTTWTGARADRFRSAWEGEFEPALRRLAQALDEAGAEAGNAGDSAHTVLS